VLLMKSVVGFVLGALAGVVAGIGLSLVIEIVTWLSVGHAHGLTDPGWVLLMLAGAAVGGARPLWRDLKRRKLIIQKEKDARQAFAAAQESAESARLRRHEQEQHECNEEMAALRARAIAIFESMPKHLSSAEEHLDHAQVDFSGGAFSPFWDSIEEAAKELGRFDEGVRHIRDHSSRYTELIGKCEDAPRQFPLGRHSVTKLGVGTTTAERMKSIVRTAQCDFHFATIYEQRKTNQILVAGFTSLAQALDRMTLQITASIDDLSGSVDAMTATLNESMSVIHSRVGDIVEQTGEVTTQWMKVEAASAAREKEALIMLNAFA
jgi:uncharacterized protein YfcZ (UPF0381/DUF406 family)